MKTNRTAGKGGVLLLCLLLIPVGGFTGQEMTADDLIYLSENFPPHNYVDQGQVMGASVEILELLWARMGAKKTREDIQMVPWARGMKSLEESPNAVLFGMGYTPERAEKFHWVGPYYDHSLALLAKKENHILIKDVKAAQGYTIGVVREDVGHQMLIKKAFSPERLQLTANLDSLYKMIEVERLPVVCYVPHSFFRHIKTQGGDPGQYEEVFEISRMKSGFGFSKNVPPALIENFQAALNELIDSKAIDRILVKYQME